MMEDRSLERDARLGVREGGRDSEGELEDAAVEVCHGFAEEGQVPEKGVDRVRKGDLEARVVVPFQGGLCELEGQLRG